ncbi:MAG TPA: four helix bundle protein [Vicinamibacterales bacterium]|nr:four helix bundle protein [Vicinamibacterales bacterium]
MAHSHSNLIAWQRADDLFIKIHVMSRAFPAFERYELGSQSRRAAFSVAANIVEGIARRGPRERVHFLHIAEASLVEVGYCMHVARRLGYISEHAHAEIESDLKKTGAPLSGLIARFSRAA